MKRNLFFFFLHFQRIARRKPKDSFKEKSFYSIRIIHWITFTDDSRLIKNEIKIIKFFETSNFLHLFEIIATSTKLSTLQETFHLRIFSELKIEKEKKNLTNFPDRRKLLYLAPNSVLNGSSGEEKKIARKSHVRNFRAIYPYLSSLRNFAQKFVRLLSKKTKRGGE